MEQDFGSRASRNAARIGGERSPADSKCSRSSSLRRYGDDLLSPSELSTGLLDLHSFDTELLPEVFAHSFFLLIVINLRVSVRVESVEYSLLEEEAHN